LDNIVVVGGGAAGVAAVETLRAGGFTGSLALVCGEPELPYDRPPLSKQVLTGAWDPDRTRFRQASHYADLNVRLVHGAARSLDAASRTVELGDGYRLGYDGLIIATGVRPRLLPSGHDLAGVHVLRGLADVAALRSAFDAASGDAASGDAASGDAASGDAASGNAASGNAASGNAASGDAASGNAASGDTASGDGAPGRVVIVGAGFLGMEVAAAARGLGLHVTVVDPLPEPMIRQVGPVIGAAIAALHRGQGVVVRTGIGVTSLIGTAGDLDGAAGGTDRVTGVALDDGSTVPADCVLVAIGAVPETEWLAGSGLGLGNGVECDPYLRAAPGVYAAGDVASWPSPRYQRRIRIEHRMNATEMGICAAKNLLSEAAGGELEAFDPLPYFWSDQYKVKLQVHGDLSADCTPTIEEGSVEGGKFVAVFRRDGVPSAVLGWSSAARMPGYRKLLLG
jgi:3-phenylpropionate/trans-cinnamate dioxygenase ferredoxin reductase component